MRDGPNALYVYLLASYSRVLYTGCTNDLHRRIYQHKHRLIPGFTSDYQVTRLVWFECHESIVAGVTRERQIKGWRR
ncbi:MAG: GIY-YIG nuclease family protein, partial [Gemmatimonadales bacterium]